MKEYRQLLPPELARTYEPLDCLKERAGRQTWLVRELESGRMAILKCCADGSEDLEEEARLLARLPEVPAVYAWGREGRQTWLAREYIPGETLLDYAQKRGPLPEEEVRKVGLALCGELKGLHGQIPPVIHRDIKAENVIRTREGRYILIDFGIARRYAEGAPRDTQVLGTPASAPPEQFG